MHKGLLILDLFVLICLTIQLLPIISVPITGEGIGYNLHLSKYGNYTFGVLGLCTSNNICSKPKIGYPPETDKFYSFMDDENGEYPDFAAAELPSRARYVISKLLVVHIVGFCFTALLFILSSTLTVILWLEESETKVPFKDAVRKKTKIRQDSRNNSSTDLTESTSATKMDSLSDKETVNNERKKDITPYLNLMLMLSLLSFLLTLLAFLSDILLFIPHLSYLGWLQLCPIILLSTVTSMLCFIKRSISSRKYLNDEYRYENDDMRKRVNVGVLNWKDTDSDDGFYVYTNGFYSNYNNDDTPQEGHSHAPELFPANISTHSGWIRHSGHNETGDDVSISSSRDDSYNEHENIQMRLLNDHEHDT